MYQAQMQVDLQFEEVALKGGKARQLENLRTK